MRPASKNPVQTFGKYLFDFSDAFKQFCPIGFLDRSRELRLPLGKEYGNIRHDVASVLREGGVQCTTAIHFGSSVVGEKSPLHQQLSNLPPSGVVLTLIRFGIGAVSAHPCPSALGSLRIGQAYGLRRATPPQSVVTAGREIQAGVVRSAGGSLHADPHTLTYAEHPAAIQRWKLPGGQRSQLGTRVIAQFLPGQLRASKGRLGGVPCETVQRLGCNRVSARKKNESLR